MPRIHLASLGCDPRTFFSQETFHHSHIGAVDAVASGRADVAATFYSVDASGKIVSAGWTGKDGETIRSVKTVATAGPIPNDMIIVSKAMPIPIRAALQRWLLALDKRSKELFDEIIHSTELRVPSAMHFQPLRAMIAGARAKRLVDW